jgi:molecular chaperone GrpE
MGRKPGGKPRPERDASETGETRDLRAGAATQGPEAEAAPDPDREAQLVQEEEVASSAETIPLEQHQRLLAEFDNYRKRVDQQQARAARWSRDELMRSLLPLLNDFDRAREALRDERQFDRDGVLIILGRLAEALKREGLDTVAASPGMAFDPEVHEAVLTVPTADVPAGSIAEVLQAGYCSGGRLLRPARVTVARAPQEDASASQEEAPS